MRGKRDTRCQTKVVGRQNNDDLDDADDDDDHYDSWFVCMMITAVEFSIRVTRIPECGPRLARRMMRFFSVCQFFQSAVFSLQSSALQRVEQLDKTSDSCTVMNVN